MKTKTFPIGLEKASFLVKWKGYGHTHNRWVSYENITPEAIVEFLRANNNYDYRWRHRCPHCDKPCRSAQGVKVHFARKCKKLQAKQTFNGTVAAKLYAVNVMTERQSNEVQIECKGTPLKNCFLFKYLGSMFAADGSEEADIKRRIGMATSRCGQLRHIFKSTEVDKSTKMKIYKCAVGSLFTYGNEAWDLTEQALRTLNGANAANLKNFTGKTRIEESRPSTTSYSLCADIRRRRLIWLGHILRMHPKRLVFRAAKVQYHTQRIGSLYMDAPRVSFERIRTLAQDRKQWKKMVDNTNFDTTPKPMTALSDIDEEEYESDTSFIEALPAKRTATTITTTIKMNDGGDNPSPVKKQWSELLKEVKKGKQLRKRPKKMELSYAHKAAWHNAHHLKHHGPEADPNGFGDKFIVNIKPHLLKDLLNDSTFLINMNIKNPSRLPNKYCVQWLSTFKGEAKQVAVKKNQDNHRDRDTNQEQQQSLKQKLRLRWRKRFKRTNTSTSTTSPITTKTTLPTTTTAATLPTATAAMRVLFDSDTGSDTSYGKDDDSYYSVLNSPGNAHGNFIPTHHNPNALLPNGTIPPSTPPSTTSPTTPIPNTTPTTTAHTPSIWCAPAIIPLTPPIIHGQNITPLPIYTSPDSYPVPPSLPHFQTNITPIQPDSTIRNLMNDPNLTL